MTTVRIAVPRKGRPLEAVLERFATAGDCDGIVDDIVSTLRYEKSVTKDQQTSDTGVYERLARYSSTTSGKPEYTLVRDSRDGKPRRIVFDSVVLSLDGYDVHLVGREEPFRALRTHEFALGFDSADLVLEEVVELREDPLRSLDAVNDRIDPRDTDVRLVGGLGDTVYHTLLAKPRILDQFGGPADRSLVDRYEGPLCISPRYERLVEAVLGSDALGAVEFVYPDAGREEEAAIADTGIGVYLTVTGGTARDHGLVVGEHLFPSQTVLLENAAETDRDTDRVSDVVRPDGVQVATELS